MTPARPHLRLSFRRRAGIPRHAAFTLLEVMVALTIMAIALTVTTGAYLAALKRGLHAERALRGAAELRYATQVISEAVRSTPLALTVQNNGRQLIVAPKTLGFAIVQETTWIDTLHNVKGSKSNQRMLKVADMVPSVVTVSVFASTARPAGAVSTGEVATYFVDAGDLPSLDLNDLFATGDTITIPATAYGPATTGVIKSISNNSGTKTLTLTAALGVDVPNGTRLLAAGGPRAMFSVENNGDLRYYPDRRNTARFTVLAHDIDAAPLSNPADSTSARTTPFAIAGRYLTLNLQQIPRGGAAGRTLQGVQTTVLVRSDPLTP